MSGGRVELGLGAGWFAQEHAAYGIPFPAKRFALLEEQLAVITGLWNTPVGETFSFDGEHYQLTESPALPKPVQSPVPVLVGGHGKKRTPALAARFASEFNLGFPQLGDIAAGFARVREACRTIGREPADLTYSVALVACVGTDEAEIARRAASIGREVDELRQNGVAGTPAEAAARIREVQELGAERIYLQILDLQDLDHLDLIAREVVPQLH